MMVRPKETGTDKSKPVAAEHICIKKNPQRRPNPALPVTFILQIYIYMYKCIYHWSHPLRLSCPQQCGCGFAAGLCVSPSGSDWDPRDETWKGRYGLPSGTGTSTLSSDDDTVTSGCDSEMDDRNWSMSAFCSWRRSSVLKKTKKQKNPKQNKQKQIGMSKTGRRSDRRQPATWQPNRSKLSSLHPPNPLFRTEQQLRETSVPISVNDQLVFFVFPESYFSL